MQREPPANGHFGFRIEAENRNVGMTALKKKSAVVTGARCQHSLTTTVTAPSAVRMPICMHMRMSIRMPTHMLVHLSIHMSMHMSVHTTQHCILVCDGGLSPIRSLWSSLMMAPTSDQHRQSFFSPSPGFFLYPKLEVRWVATKTHMLDRAPGSELQHTELQISPTSSVACLYR